MKILLVDKVLRVNYELTHSNHDVREWICIQIIKKAYILGYWNIYGFFLISRVLVKLYYLCGCSSIHWMSYN